jgi:hypothetical protein
MPTSRRKKVHFTAVDARSPDACRRRRVRQMKGCGPERPSSGRCSKLRRTHEPALECALQGAQNEGGGESKLFRRSPSGADLRHVVDLPRLFRHSMIRMPSSVRADGGRRRAAWATVRRRFTPNGYSGPVGREETSTPRGRP